MLAVRGPVFRAGRPVGRDVRTITSARGRFDASPPAPCRIPALSVIAVTFGLIFVAELPDKTAVAGLMLGPPPRLPPAHATGCGMLA